MEFLKLINKRRSILSEIIYFILNISLAIILLLVIKFTGSLLSAIIIVFLSKWRVFAVRPRFWIANIQDNAISFIVDVSYVIAIYFTNIDTSKINSLSNTVLQIILAMLYIGWLIWLKPKSKRIYVIAQAGVALFCGITAIFMVSYSWIATPVVILVWLIGYITARHVLGSYDEDNITLLSLSSALLMAEIGWLAYHWTIAYKFPFIANLLIPQASIISLAAGFLAYKSYDSYYHHQKIKFNDIILPLVFTVCLIGVLLLFRNGV